MQEDLLPIRHLTNDELVPSLKQALGADLEESEVAYLLERQLRMEGTYILHSETAKRNGGDFDFDTICVMPSDQFPRLLRDGSRTGNSSARTKTKHHKGEVSLVECLPGCHEGAGKQDRFDHRSEDLVPCCWTAGPCLQARRATAERSRFAQTQGRDR
jgi:hypothetical protein